ncbi:sugar kinase [Rhodobacterales bacterium HKCCE2091]|nr:sugar kinase [Rhodobacterales bacterium HKCCE2091]
MTARLLCIGECMIEMAPQADGRYAMGFAGDTFNTAWYARRAGVEGLEVAYLSAVGDDGPSRAMTDFIRDAGVVPELKVRPGRTVGLYLISLKDGERSFSYWRSTAAARTLADDLDTLPGIGAGDLVYFSGITLAILPDAGRERLLAAIAAARWAGAWVAFDPNLRPRLWATGDEMRHWVMEGAKAADIALPSFEDEADHFGDADPAATAARYAEAGCSRIIVKNGPGQMLIRDGSETAVVTPVPAAEVVDTTAAGDSFNGAFFAALMAGQSAVEAAAEGTALAAKVIGARGALVAV